MADAASRIPSMFLAQLPAAPQLPPLPEGPALNRVRGPVEIPAYEPWQIVLAVGCVVLFLGLLLWLFWRARKKSAPSIPPYEAAMCELDAAARLTAGDDDRFAVRSSMALRRYLLEALGLQRRGGTCDARGGSSGNTGTTQELLHRLAGDKGFGPDFQNRLGQTLTAFDRVKFAGQGLSPEERSRLTDAVRQLIEEVHQCEARKGGDS